jgi:hypothetical protein
MVDCIISLESTMYNSFLFAIIVEWQICKTDFNIYKNLIRSNHQPICDVLCVLDQSKVLLLH